MSQQTKTRKQRTDSRKMMCRHLSQGRNWSQWQFLIHEDCGARPNVGRAVGNSCTWSPSGCKADMTADFYRSDAYCGGRRSMKYGRVMPWWWWWSFKVRSLRRSSGASGILNGVLNHYPQIPNAKTYRVRVTCYNKQKVSPELIWFRNEVRSNILTFVSITKKRQNSYHLTIQAQNHTTLLSITSTCAVSTSFFSSAPS